jgi:hypothetical protein
VAESGLELCREDACFEEALEGFEHCEEHLTQRLDEQDPWDDIDYYLGFDATEYQ